MTWTSPPTVATGDIYTAAMFNTYTRDNPNHLRSLLPDPLIVDRPLVADTLTTASFRLLPDAGMLNQKVDEIPPTVTTFAGALAYNSAFINVANGGAAIADAPVSATDMICIQLRNPNTAIDYRVQIAFNTLVADTSYIRWILGGAPTTWRILWNSGNDGSGTGLDANLVNGLSLGNGSGNIPVNNAVMSVNLNAQYLQSYFPSNGGGPDRLAINNGVLNSSLDADTVDSHHAADITPNNARVWFATVAEVTAAGAHWSRDTTLNGRYLLGADEAGGVGGVIFDPNTNYGANWTPSSGLSVGVGTLAVNASLDVAGSLGNSSNNVNITVTGGATPMATGAHTHDISSLGISGSVTLTGAPSISGTTTPYIAPTKAGIWAKKS